MKSKLRAKGSGIVYLFWWDTNLPEGTEKAIKEKLDRLDIKYEMVVGVPRPNMITFE